MIVLKNKRLEVCIAEPGEAENAGYRFDQSGFITDVILDGTLRFCASEPRNLPHVSSGGRGFCSEIRCDLSQERDENGRYPKFGVGLIPYDGDPYVFFRRYPETQRFPISFRKGAEWVTFEVQPLACNGYALHETKTIQLSGNTITVSYKMKNTGDKTVSFSEYCHNFISMDGMALSSDWVLHLPQVTGLEQGVLKDAGGTVLPVSGEGDTMVFADNTHRPSMTILPKEQMSAETGTFTWMMEHTGIHTTVRGTESFVPDGVTVWSFDHVASPEVFHDVTLEPGQEAVWSRSLQFELM